MGPVTDPALLEQLNQKPVTDPAVLAQLEGGGQPAGTPISDPALLAQLNAPAAPKQTTFMDTVRDIGLVYPAVEAALHATTALFGGFPAFLGGAVGTMLSEGRAVTPKAKEVASGFSEAMTYQPRTERGKRLANTVMYPFQKFTELGEAGGKKVADVTGSAPLAALTEATIQMGAPVLGAKGIAKAASNVKGEFKRPEEATGGDAPIEAPRPFQAPPVKLDSLIREAETLGRGGIPVPPKNLLKLAVPRAARQENIFESGRSGVSVEQYPDAQENVQRVRRGESPPAAEVLPRVPRGIDEAQSPEAPGTAPRGAAAGELQGLRERVSQEGQIEAPPVQGLRGQGTDAPPRLSPSAGSRMAVQEAPSGATSGRGYTPIDWTRADEIGATRAIRSETLEGGVAGDREAKVNQVLSWLEPEKGRGRADVDATIFDAGREYETPEAKQRAFNDLYDTFDQDPALRAEYPEFYTERGQVDKRAVDAVARSYNTYVSTQMNAARRANEGKDTAIHPGSFDEFRGRGERGAPPEAPPLAPAPEAPAGEIPPPPGAREGEIGRPPVEEEPIASARELREPMGEEARPATDAEALEKYGPGTLGMNPMFDPMTWKDTLKPLVALNKEGQKLMNNAQAMPESAYPAAAAGYDFARANYTARETAQLDRAANYKDKAGIERDYKEALEDARALDPKYDPGSVTTVKEASVAAEKAKIRAATLELQKELLTSGVAVLPGKATSLEGYVKPTNYAAFTTPGGRVMYLRRDAAPVLEQMVSGYDWLAERKYMEGWGKVEATSHGITGMLLAVPTFHIVTVGGRVLPAAINMPSNNILRFGKSSWEAMQDRAQMKDMMEHGVTFFPKRQTFDPSGAEMGLVEKHMRDMGLGKPYEGYQWVHSEVLANAVNWMETMYYQWRLNQLTSGHKGHMPAGTLDTYKTMAARDASNAAANLAKEEGNRTWFRILGNVAFSRGLQVNTVRMATRALEGDRILEAVAARNGMTIEQAKEVVQKNKAFLGRQLAKDYVAMVVAANVINYYLTSIEDEPNGKKGGHFVWENQGSDKTQTFLPLNIFVGTREVNGKNVGVYMSTPFRSARDVIEYAMLPYELIMGEPGKILKNKASVPLKLAEEHLWTGKDYAGRPLGGTYGAAGNVVSHMTPSPFEDIPRYAMEAWAQGNPTYFSEGLAKVFDPTLFPLKAAGMQPKVLKPDPETTLLQGKQLREEEKVRGRASKLKADLFGMSAETRARAIESLMEDAEKAGMDAKGKGSLRRYLQSEGVTRGATKAANRRLQANPNERKDQISTPPGYD